MSSTYICDPIACTQVHKDFMGGNGSGVCWHESLWRRLSWQYGENRANTIVLGLDGRTEADQAAWNTLGS